LKRLSRCETAIFTPHNFAGLQNWPVTLKRTLSDRVSLHYRDAHSIKPVKELTPAELLE
jgi:hypothetical protein